uniref:NAD-dependent epimerase/dehydratase domain-containing protein n=1 Tax=Lotus japonicus TaxID=34305 RepID=I3SJK0_LOTJA|nr:unknown [Lotus japonicus]
MYASSLTHKLAGNETHYSIIKQGQFVHIDDLCLAHIFLFEHPEGEGRYVCSACDANIHDIANLINSKYPEYKVPTKFKNIPDQLELVRFSSKKIKDIGFQFKYSLEDMYIAGIDMCREKGLLPKHAKTPGNGITQK